MFLLGTIVNALAICVGSVLGLIIPSIPERIKSTMMQGIGLAVALTGLSMSLSDTQGNDILIIIVSLALGALVGEWMNIEAALERLGKRIEKRVAKGPDSRVAEAFVVSSLLFCVGSMAIVGAIQSGFEHKHGILFEKSILDGVTALVFASTLGVGVALSAVPVLLYEGLIATISFVAGNALNAPAVIHCMAATGGLLILGIGINILGIKKIAVGNLLPSMFIAALIKWGLPYLHVLS